MSPASRPGAGDRRLRVAGGAEAGEDLPPDRVVPVAERATAGDRGDAERATAEHLVLAAEEDLGVLPVRPRGEAGVGQEVAGGPLPHVPDELPHARRARALRVAARGGGLQVALAQVRPVRRRVLVTPWEPARPPGGRVVPRRLLPLSLGRQPPPRPRRVRLR